MHIPKNDTLLKNARRLRKEMTPQELRLWYRFLRIYPVKIYKQRIIGNYIVDFYCASAKLVIEIDGSQHYEDEGKAHDAQRTAFLEGLGLKVIRYSNREINCSFYAVCEQIDQVIQERRACSTDCVVPSPPSAPLPKGEGGSCCCLVKKQTLPNPAGYVPLLRPSRAQRA